MSDLFQVPESKSPRLLWIEKIKREHRIYTHHAPGSRGWLCHMCGYGWTFEETEPTPIGIKAMKLSSLKQQIEELDAKATKGPWKSQVNHSPYKVVWISKREMYSTLELKPDDADFIALSRTALPELLRRLLVAEEALKLFSADSSWRINGVCDPNSGRFEGQTIATAALATIRGEEE